MNHRMPGIPTLLLLPMLAGCEPIGVGPDGDSGGTGDDPGAWDGDEGPWIEDEGETSPPAFDAAALGTAVDEAILLARDTHAGPIIEGLATVFGDMDETCPAWFEQDGVPYWYDACTAESGTRFDGYAYVLESTGTVDEEGNTWDGVQLFSIATIETAAGRVVETGGSAGLLAGTSADGAALSYSYMEHGFADSGAASGWMAEGIDPAAVTWAAHYGEAGGGMYVDGVYTELSGELSAVVFDEVTVLAEALGGCALEPAATLSLLTGEGEWIELVFDTDDPADPACDGCGTAAWQGIVLGEVCTDFSPLVDFDGSPWW